jgi:hypothetical protein
MPNLTLPNHPPRSCLLGTLVFSCALIRRTRFHSLDLLLQGVSIPNALPVLILREANRLFIQAFA